MKIREKEKELRSLKKSFKNASKTTQKVVEPTLELLAFMIAELSKLANEIDVAGWTEPYQNGANQKGIKKSAAGEAFNSLIKNYNSLLATMQKFLSESDTSTQDEFDKYISM